MLVDPQDYNTRNPAFARKLDTAQCSVHTVQLTCPQHLQANYSSDATVVTLQCMQSATIAGTTCRKVEGLKFHKQDSRVLKALCQLPGLRESAILPKP